MTSPTPFFKVRRDRFEVLQGKGYVRVDRLRVEGVQYRAGVLTVHYGKSGEIALGCTKAETADLKRLVQALQEQRDWNSERERIKKRNDSGSILPMMF
jgi:hypothetical protein